MTAIAPPQLAALPQKPNPKSTSDYINPQCVEPLVHPPRHAASSNSLGKGSKGQENNHENEPTDPYPDPETSKTLIKAKSDTAKSGPEINLSKKSNEGQDLTAARPRGHLQRANTDRGPRRQSLSNAHSVPEENWELRHGWEDQYNSSEYLKLLSSVSTQRLLAIKGTLYRLEADGFERRLSTCTIRISAMKQVANPKMRIIVIHLKNGGCEIG